MSVSSFLNMQVLWNHTKKVYIRLSTALDELEDSEVTVYDDYHLMGTLLLLHICWSSDPNTSMGYSGDALRRGSWAGDRFGFTRQHVLGSRLEQEKGKWKDVSKEVMRLFEVFEADLCPGKNWKKKISRYIREYGGAGYMPRRLRSVTRKAAGEIYYP